MTAPGLAERRGAGQRQGRRGDRGHDHGGVLQEGGQRRPASRGSRGENERGLGCWALSGGEGSVRRFWGGRSLVPLGNDSPERRAPPPPGPAAPDPWRCRRAPQGPGWEGQGRPGRS